MPRVILIDQDSVLADFDGEIRRRCQEQFPDMPLKPYELHTDFYFSGNYDEPWKSMIKNIYVQPGFILSLPPIPGGLEAIRELVDREKTIRICTSPLGQYKHCVGEKYEWVDRYLGPKFVDMIILAKDKTYIRGDYLIDDRPKIIGDLTPSWEHIIFDQPYNRHIADKRRINWQNWKSVLLGQTGER